MKKSMAMVLCSLLFWACNTKEAAKPQSMDVLAERYVKAQLQLGQYDKDIVDAYYGPAAWKPAPLPESKPTLDSLTASQLLQEFTSIQSSLKNYPTDTLEEMEKQRLEMFQKQILAAVTKVEMMQGKVLPFDEEAQLLYDATPPHFT